MLGGRYQMDDFILEAPLSEIDPDVKRIINLEEERQKRKLIFIPSESSAPFAVHESLGSVLQNIYAEGYPPENSRTFTQKEILDVDKQIANFRRYSGPRYYKGVEYADILEELARRRCAELFATRLIDADNIYVNVQPLSGAPANNAVYHALIEPGDVVVGMNLFHGGHLTHGSSVNRSGKLYNAFHYNVDPATERINYDTVQQLVNEKQPKLLIAGYSSYPWAPDWERFADIAHSAGALLFADISHIAGPIAAGAIPSPVGFADIITFTTHKTLCGPRGACILSFNNKTSSLIDKAVFPGEQGGPHIHVYAGMATAFKLAKTKQFIDFQSQIIKNCKILANTLSEHEIRVAFGGTDTHLFNIDCKSIKGKDGTFLSGDMAARIFDIAGLVMNANTIPGDTSAFRSTGVRIGTPWITQRGLVEKDMVEIGEIIADLLHAIEPYTVTGKTRPITRAKIDFTILEHSKIRVRTLINKTVDWQVESPTGYPNYFFLDDFENMDPNEWLTFNILGSKITESLNWIFSTNTEKLPPGKPVSALFYADRKPINCYISYVSDENFKLTLQARDSGLGITWLRDLSDGFIAFDKDLKKKIPGPFIIKKSKTSVDVDRMINDSIPDVRKPYFINIGSFKKNDLPSLKEFIFSPDKDDSLKRTALYDVHKSSGAKIIPFAGWEMPVWYSSVTEEHNATRNAAGLFDVSHMGVFEAQGTSSGIFLDCVCGNSISDLNVGESCYTHLLDLHAKVIDDLLIYRHVENKFLIVVNASNSDKDWEWLEAVNSGKIRIDKDRPWATCFGRDFTLKNLNKKKAKDEQRIDIALQGPLSKEILLKIGFSKKDLTKINKLRRTQLCHAIWEGNDLIISRTGYTGEKMAFEIFIHPKKSIDLWNRLLETGKPLGIKPCGLGARDSLRTEAGLPLYGHEMGGEFNLGVAEAGFGSYIKVNKPWFIGRSAYLENEKNRKREVIRFRFEDRHTKFAHLGDRVFNDKGKHIGFVTSCAIDKDGFLTGQAWIDKKYRQVDTRIFIFQKSDTIKSVELSTLPDGQKITLPSKANVVRRFPRL